MSLLVNNLIREILEAERRSMQALLDAWDKEIQAQAEAFRELQKKQAQQQLQELTESAALEAHLRTLVCQAKAGADITVSIPPGVRVADNLAVAASDTELQVMLSKLEQAAGDTAQAAQRSAAWALGQGFVPHPGDLATLMDQQRVDAPWSAALKGLAGQLEQLDASRSAHPQLKALHGGERLTVVQAEVKLLGAYSPERTLQLVTRPSALGGSLEKAPPALDRSQAGPKMGQQALNRLLDRLF